AVAPAGRQVRPERSGGRLSGGAALAGPASSAVFRHTLPGGRAVPLSGRTAGESDHLRPGVPRRALSRRVGGHGPEPGGAPAAA
ncbi:DUF2442 domain-containing protein, partial [Dysosmobacter welbionis]